MPQGSSIQPPKRASAEMKRLLVTMIVAVVGLDAAVIGLYYGFHIRERTDKTQETFVAVWVVLTLLVVATLLRRIRQARRRA